MWSVSLLLVVIWVVGSGMSWGVCRVEEGTDPRVMVRELTGTCSEEDRQALAVSADDVLAALQQGSGVVLKGVVLSGDLSLDRLNLQPFDPGLVKHPAIVERIQAERVSEVRVIHGPFMLEDVEVQGILATNLIKPGYIVVRGPVSLRDSTIQQSVDLSRMVFMERADFSDMHIGHEGFFIRAMFARDADFTRAVFGTHSRFHQPGSWERPCLRERGLRAWRNCWRCPLRRTPSLGAPGLFRGRVSPEAGFGRRWICPDPGLTVKCILGLPSSGVMRIFTGRCFGTRWILRKPGFEATWIFERPSSSNLT